MSKYVLNYVKIIYFWFMIILICKGIEYESDDVIVTINRQVLTCTTTARIIHNEMKYHLHSHAITYGSGSAQQSVTGLKADNDVGSLWIFKEADGDQMWLTGSKIQCGDKIRIEHMNTKRNLHSHEHSSPVSNRQEVSCFGDDGEGDTADNWFIVCKDAIKGEPITGKTLFYLKHEETNKYLYTDKGSMFTNRNCRNWPIVGQAEISAANNKNKNALWKFQFYASFDVSDEIDDNDEFVEEGKEKYDLIKFSLFSLMV